MRRDSQNFPASTSPDTGLGVDSMAAQNLGKNDRWLLATEQLDIETSKVRILAQRLTQLQSGERKRAVAIHDYVQNMPFGCIADFQNTKASDVLRLGYGDCHTKGVLFVALMRAAGMPARLRFVTLPTRFLRGLIDTGSQTMTHAVGEVFLEGVWQQVDTYVVDTAFGAAARAKLQSEGAKLGYGVHLDAAIYWDAIADAHGQSTPLDTSSMPIIDWGVSDDTRSFYADEEHAALRHTFTVRVKWMLAAPVVNQKVAQIRKAGR